MVRAAQPATQADAAARPEGCGHFVARSRHERDTGVSWRRSLVAIRWVARRRRGRSERVAIQALRSLAPAAPTPPRGAPNPIPHYPAPRFPSTIPARPTSWRWCHQYIPSVVRAAQPATQADAAVRPTDAGHFGARSRHKRDTGI